MDYTMDNLNLETDMIHFIINKYVYFTTVYYV